MNHKYTRNDNNLSFDHTPVVLTVSENIKKTCRPKLHNKRTDWDHFREIIENRINLKIPLKTTNHIELAVEHFTKTVQEAAWTAMPNNDIHQPVILHPAEINKEVALKRKQRKMRQIHRNPTNGYI